MISDRLDSIMKTLCDVTNSDTLVWEKTSKVSKDRTYKRTLTSLGEDNTEYDFVIIFASIKNEPLRDDHHNGALVPRNDR